MSMFTSLALFRSSKSFSSDNFLVSMIRLNVGTCLIIFKSKRTFSGLSTKIVFNDAKIPKETSHYFFLKFSSKRTLINNMNNRRFTKCVIEWYIDHAMKMACYSSGHPLEISKN